MAKFTKVEDFITYDIGFYRDLKYDETEFDIVYHEDVTVMMSELMNLFNDFLKENNFNNIKDISVIEKCRTSRTTVIENNDTSYYYNEIPYEDKEY